MEHFFYLQDLMEKEIEAYKELLALSQQEKDAIMGNDVNSLSVIVEKQQAALADIKKIEREKEPALAGIRMASGMTEGKDRLKDIIGIAPDGMRERLKSLTKELESIAAKLRRAGTINRMLIDAQLQYAAYCINLLTGRQNTLNTYSESGRREEGCAMQRNLVDQTI